MIQDISPHMLCNQFDPAAVPEPEDFVLLFERSEEHTSELQSR